MRRLADLQHACAPAHRAMRRRAGVLQVGEPAHRAMLEQAIADLDQRLAALENPNTQIPKPKSQ